MLVNFVAGGLFRLFIQSSPLWRYAVFAVVVAMVVAMGLGVSSGIAATRSAPGSLGGVELTDITPNYGRTSSEVREGEVLVAQAGGGGTTTIAKTRSVKTNPKGNVVRSAVLSGNRSATTFRMELSKGVPAEVFTLANPYRVVIDLPGVVFSLPERTGVKGRGLVSAFRYGLFAARKARVVLDTVHPVRIDKATMLRKSGGAVVLEIVFSKTDRKSFGAGTGAARSGPKVARSNDPVRAGAGTPAKRGRRTKPVVMIDAGHGGIDPGALGEKKTHEKTIVLAVAKRLKKRLIEMGGFSVFMTRRTDVFVSLDRRLEHSKKRGADVFISLHADSIADKRYARTVSGATVYTLSSRASDEQARLMAEKENKVDALAGIDASGSDKAVEVRNILIDLLKRETANFSTALSNVLVGKLKGAVRLSRKPRRSADFKVLRQTRTPSVLIELGYMSNKQDVEMMAGAQWQKKAANAIAASIEAYFARRSRQAR